MARAGDIVLSLAGRDSGRLFMVISADGQFVRLCDGKTRRTENPKLKKLKHVKLVGTSQSPAAHKLRAGEQVIDSELRKGISAFQTDIRNGGGGEYV